MTVEARNNPGPANLLARYTVQDPGCGLVLAEGRKADAFAAGERHAKECAGVTVYDRMAHAYQPQEWLMPSGIVIGWRKPKHRVRSHNGPQYAGRPEAAIQTGF